jgi:hypothetical protein
MAKAVKVTFVDGGHLSERDPNFGLLVACYVCTTQHKALGVARIIQEGASPVYVPLCEACLVADKKGNAVLRKFLNAPDLEIAEGGSATTEQVLALGEKQGTTEH